MNDPNQAGKSRPPRPPILQKKPSKPPKPGSKPVKSGVNESVTGGENKDTERQPNHINTQSESANGPPPAAPPKPKFLSEKQSDNANGTNNGITVSPEIVNSIKPDGGGNDTIDGGLTQVTQALTESTVIENKKEKVSTPTSGSSPRLPPRRAKNNKTEQNADGNQTKDKVSSTFYHSANNSTTPNLVTVSRSSSSCSGSGERPQTRPKPPRRRTTTKENALAKSTSEIQNGETVISAIKAPIVQRSHSPAARAVNDGSSSEQSSIIAKEDLKDNKLPKPSKDLSGNNIGKSTKIALKPRPSRPPPPFKRPSQMSKSDDIPNKKDDQISKVKGKPPATVIKPKPPKPFKLPPGGDSLSRGIENTVKEAPVTTQKELNLQKSQSVGKEEERVKVGDGVVNDGQLNTVSQPLPPPRKKRLSLIVMESQDNVTMDAEPKEVATDDIDGTEKGNSNQPSPATPGISRLVKRSSNGTMFAVIGESRLQNVVEADATEKTVEKDSSDEGKQETPGSTDEKKPRRVAPTKPPPPSQQALMKQKSMKESPNTSPTRKPVDSPQGTPVKRPQARPPPVPAGKKKDGLEKGSVKTPPKRPLLPSSMRKAVKEEVSKVKSPAEENQQKEREKDEVDVDSDKEVILSPAPCEDGQDEDVFNKDISASTSTTEESKEEPLSSRSESFVEEDDFSSDEFSDEETSSKFEEEPEPEPEDAAFMEGLPKGQKKAYQVAKEIRDSEAVFVDVLKLLNEDFRSHIEFARDKEDQPVVDKATLDLILGYLPQLHMFNEELLTDFKKRILDWPTLPKISDVFIKKGPYLKLYTTYIQTFEKQTADLEDACNRYPHFKAAVREFEASPRCKSLQVRHYMLKPIQRIPQYRLLLNDYQKNLEAESIDDEDTKVALKIVSEVASHVNDLMKSGDALEKLLDIQHSLLGRHDIVKPGRIFIKEGILNKVSRKEFQQRKIFLLNDVLLTTASFPSGLRLKAELPLEGMKVTEPQQIRGHENEFNIFSVERSFTLAASSPEEKEEWVKAINKAVADVIQKRNTFMGEELSVDGGEFVLGQQAPIWIPDARVTMCQICTSEFTITWRRHHCRACGKVVCGNCSKHKVPLEYLKKHGRVCNECNDKLGGDVPDGPTPGKVKRRKSRVTPSKSKILKEVSATDKDITIKGYLQYKEKRNWKKMWFVVKDKVLYTYKASEDVAAEKTFPLIGFTVSSEELEIKLTQAKICYIFKADTQASADEWATAFGEATRL